MLKKILVAIAVLILLLVVIGIFLPREWSVSRSILIAAPTDKIHPYTSTPSRYREWFDWEEMSDPTLVVETGGPVSGKGAWYSWKGEKAGSGRLTITDADPATGIYLELAIESDTPNAKGSILYTAADGGATRVTWSEGGELPPVLGGYLKGYVEEVCGKAFDGGLAKLKSAVEAAK
jgi:hypothetical protein